MAAFVVSQIRPLPVPCIVPMTKGEVRRSLPYVFEAKAVCERDAPSAEEGLNKALRVGESGNPAKHP
jgi:hypothetical protein